MTENMQGKTVIITGANSGIGKAAAFQMAELGAHVILACRSIERGSLVQSEIMTAVPNAHLLCFYWTCHHRHPFAILQKK